VPIRIQIFRLIWLKIHLYLGLSAGLLFVLLGLTGSVLVFHRAIDAALNADLLTATGSGAPRPLDEIVAAATRVAPPSASLLDVMAPERDNGVFQAYFEATGAAGAQALIVFVHPWTAEVLGTRPPDDHATGVLYGLHATLLLGDSGHFLVGAIGIVALVSLLTGLYLWWPRAGQVRAAFIVKRGAKGYRLLFDLHGVHGIYPFIVLVAVVFSGVYLVFPASVTGLVRPFMAVDDFPAGLTSTASPGSRPLSAGEAVALAMDRFPGAAFRFATLPSGAGDTYRVVLRQEGEVRKTGGSTVLWIDQYSGEILAVRNPKEFGPGTTFINWQFPVHNGEALGMFGRVLVFLSGFIPLILYVTGFLMWWQKRRARAL
jgi:uncharacterized iron-regulated membrane protein